MSGIVISGLGTLSPLGDTPRALFSALLEGRSAFAGGGPAEIADFDATRYASVRGMRMYNRATQLAICAARLALADAKLEDAKPEGATPGTAALPGEQLGLLMASTYGHLDVLLDYDRSLVENGLQRTNGALMALAIPSAPGALTALALGAKAFSVTLSDNGSSFVDALALGARWVDEGRARACVVVGAFSASAAVRAAVARAGLLSLEGCPRVYGRHADGAALGEGSVAFVLEHARDAASRGARAHGRIGGYGAAFATAETGLEGATHRAAASALSGLDPDELALVSAGGSGLPELDHPEARALHSLLAGRSAPVPVIAVKALLGETFDAAGGFQALAALAALAARKAPPIPTLAEPAVPGLGYVTRTCAVSGTCALVTSPSRGGSCGALVLHGPEASHG